MSDVKQQTHKPGALKQSNKSHKHGRHKSNGVLKAAGKGKVSVKTISKKMKTELNREQRRHQASQIRQNKRNDVLSKKRLLGGMEHCPFLVSIVSLNKDYDPTPVLSMLTECDPESIVYKNDSGVTHITLPRFKQRFAFIIPPADNEFAILDAMKVSNTTMFVISAAAGISFGSELVDKYGHRLLLASFGQGLPSPAVVVTDLESVPMKKRGEQKQKIQKLVNKWLPDEKIVTLDKSGDAINILRKIGNQKQKAVLYRDRRPHMYAEDVEFVHDAGFLGTLKVTGYLRGTPLSANDLVYLPGLGTYQMSQIDSPPEPAKVEKSRKDDAMDEDKQEKVMIRVLERPHPSKQESLVSENIPDPMDAEQTWPTQQEIDDEQQDTKKKIKKVPKGWSEYQSAWIPDDEAQFASDNSDDESETEKSDYMDAISEEKSEYSEAEDEFDTLTISEIPVNDQQYDEQLDMNAEISDLEKVKAAKSDLIFPDEIDTPHDVPARERFQKYRGLESFRTSPWDPKENLPLDYARIFQFENFDRTKKRVLKEVQDKDGANPGWYVTIHVKEVPKSLWNSFQATKSPLILFGLFPHENKMSVVNVVLKRTGLSEEAIKSKERLIFQCGYRRFIVNPIFSQHTNGTKHKFERFFQPNSTTVATFFAPIQFPPAPVLCYKEVNNQLILVATGSVLSCNPDRIIVKRLVLSGHPFKVHKRSAVIRFMFFNREDILYFKPCKLRTKHGRVGHIKEPLGTHGHMKCIFDGQIKSQDTVLLTLYKRIFPKWTFEECTMRCEDNNMEI